MFFSLLDLTLYPYVNENTAFLREKFIKHFAQRLFMNRGIDWVEPIDIIF